MRYAVSSPNRRIIGRLEKGDDLVSTLVQLCRKENITAGEIRGLGAVTDLFVTEYDVGHQVYRDPIHRKEASEILTLYGNVSEKDGELFAHLHISASFMEDSKSHLIAGHLTRATVFACEFVIDVFDDVSLVRNPDEPTGLFLWSEVKEK